MAGGRGGSQVVFPNRLEGLLPFPFGMLGGQRMHTLKYEHQLDGSRRLPHSVPSLPRTAIRSDTGPSPDLPPWLRGARNP